MNYLTTDKAVLINSLFRYSLQALFTIILSVVVGLIFNHFRPNGLTIFSETASLSILRVDDANRQFDRLSIDEALEEYNLGESLFIDARGYNHYILGHIQGAISIPANRFDDFFENAFKNIAVNRKIIVYCDSFNCGLSEEVANKLFIKGFNNIKIFEDGWEKWFEAFLPIKEGQ